MKSLKGKVFLITGAEGGFGTEFSKQLLQLGAHLVLTSLNKDVLDENIAKFTSNTPNITGEVLGAFASDLSSKSGCEKAFKQAIEISNNIDFLINNAGQITYGYFDETPLDKTELLLNVNVMAPVFLSHHFINAFKNRGSGHIVNISSVSGYIATTKASAYSVSKFAMRSFGMTLHSEIKRFGMNVSNIYPFFSKTGLLNTKPHGTAVMPSLPDFFYDKPASVVKDAIKGIRKNRLHIYPGFFGKPLYYATKLLPIVSDMNK